MIKKVIPGLCDIELWDTMGNDLKVVNCARNSFNVEKKELDETDIKLIKYLSREGHTAPYRHCYVTFAITCPEFVARHLYKHAIGIGYCQHPINDHGWSEASGRYIEANTLGFHEPDSVRVQAKSSKQASIPDLEGKIDQEKALKIIEDTTATCERAFEQLREMGVCKEQSRMVLPLLTNTRWIWTLSLQAFAHLVYLRDDKHAQGETQTIIHEMYEMVKDTWCPVSLQSLVDEFRKKT